MLLESLEIFVYKVDNNTFELLGTIDKFSSLIWPDKFLGYDTFELWAPITEQNKELIKQGNVIWTGFDNACVIEIVNPQTVSEGVRKYYVKGRTLEKFLEERIIWGTYVKSGKTSAIMYDIVNRCCINPDDTKRKIPYLVNATDEGFGEDIKVQKTGGHVYDFLLSLSEENGIGFRIEFKPREEKLVFRVIKSKNRTRTNIEGNDVVELSTEFDDILSSEYCSNNQNYRNVAFVQGEAKEDAPRVSTTSGAISLEGFDRKELYVDARDLQSEVYDEDVQRTIPPDEYLQMLVNRGNEKLADRIVEESFTATVRQQGLVQYTLGVDYNNGDYITIVDEELGISVDAQVTNVVREYDDKYNLRLTFGYARPTLLERVKKITS